MAQVPKPLPIAPTPPASAESRVGPGHRVASVTQAPVDELAGSATVAFDAAPSGFKEGSLAHTFRREGDGSGNAFADGRLFTADSQVFAAILEAPDRQGGGSDVNRGRAFTGSVTQAISIYETNAKVIAGEQPVLGTEVNTSQ